MIDELAMLIQRGGYIMVPLLILSIVSMTLIVERTWFWFRVHGTTSVNRLTQLNDSLRKGDVIRSLTLIRRHAD